MSENTNDLLNKIIKKLEETHLLEREILTAIQSIKDIKQEDPRQEETLDSATLLADTPAAAFKVGDLVRITNRIRQPFGGGLKRPIENSGVIVRITKRRIHVKLTGTGLIIQRDPSNVEHR